MPGADKTFWVRGVGGALIQQILTGLLVDPYHISQKSANYGLHLITGQIDPTKNEILLTPIAKKCLHLTTSCLYNVVNSKQFLQWGSMGGSHITFVGFN